MALPQPPTSYAATVDLPNDALITFVNGAGAVSVRHELSTDGGQNWNRLDDDQVPTTSSHHNLPSNSTVQLRAKSVNAEGESAYTDVVQVVTGGYDEI